MATSDFQNRVLSAKASAKFAKIVGQTAEGQINKLLVPGHQGKQYEVIIRRGSGFMSVECRLSAGSIGFVPCPSLRAVCYHGVAALMVAAGEKGKKLSFCQTAEDAKNLAHTGGSVFEVKNHSAKPEDAISIWAVVK